MENYNKNLKLFITNWIESPSHLFKKDRIVGLNIVILLLSIL